MDANCRIRKIAAPPESSGPRMKQSPESSGPPKVTPPLARKKQSPESSGPQNEAVP